MLLTRLRLPMAVKVISVCILVGFLENQVSSFLAWVTPAPINFSCLLATLLALLKSHLLTHPWLFLRPHYLCVR